MATETAAVDARAALKRELLKRKLADQAAQAQGVPPAPKNQPIEGGRFAAQATGATVGGLLGSPLGLPGTMGGAALGGMAGEEGYNLLRKVTGQPDNRTTTQHLVDTGLAGASAGTGEALGAVAGAGLNAVGRTLLRGGGGRQRIGDTVKTFAEASGGKASPTVGQATGSIAWQSAENAAARFPGPHAPLLTKARDTITAIDKHANQLADNMAFGKSLDPETGGIAAKEGIEFWKDKFNRVGDAAFTRMRRLIPPDTPTMASNTRAALASVTTPDPRAPNITGSLINPKLAQMSEGLDKDILAQVMQGQQGIPVSALFQLRTQVGNKLSDFALVDDIPRSQLKKLYGAITDDMRATAQGNPQALAAFERANTMWAAGMTRVDNFLHGLASKGYEPEKLFRAIELAKGNVTMIRELGKTLGPEEKSIIGGVLLKRMGRSPSAQQNATGELWNAKTFFKNWQDTSDVTKEVFFGSPLGSTRYNLDKIVKTAETLKESGEIFANPPNTAASLVGTMTYAAAIGSAAVGQTHLLTALLGASAGGWVGAKTLLTNPRFINWLGQATTLKSGPKAISNHLGRLATIAANSDPETRDAIKDYLGFISQDQQQAPRQ